MRNIVGLRQSKPTFWPYALRPANKVHNVTPDILRSDFKSPLQLLTNTTVTADLGHFRPFGCPVYVLDNSMHQGTKIGKWEARSRMGLYLGMSTVHARSVALVLNLTTGHVSPQFHLKFDSNFETVGAISLPTTAWQHACYFKDQRTPTPRQARGRKESTDQQETGEEEMMEDDDAPDTEPLDDVGEAEIDEQPADQGQAPPPDGRRRSTRHKPGSRLDHEDIWVSMEAQLEKSHPSHVAFETCREVGTGQRNLHPLKALAASADPDTMYYHEAMKEPDRDQCIKAMKQEV